VTGPSLTSTYCQLQKTTYELFKAALIIKTLPSFCFCVLHFFLS